MNSVFPSCLDNMQALETQLSSFQSCPQRKFATPDWLPESNLLLRLLAGWAFSLPLPMNGSLHRETDTTEARGSPTGRKSQGKDDGKREATRY